MAFNFEKYAPDYEWWDFVFEDAKAIGALIGFDISNIYFSGFSSQGDGACFEGRLSYRKGALAAVKAYAPKDTELHAIAKAWQAAQASQFYSISGSVRHSGHYSHEYCTSFDFEDSRYSYGWPNGSFDESAFIEPARDFMRWIYRQLEAEYEYLQAASLAFGWQQLRDDMAENRQEARQLVRDMRAAIKSGMTAAPSICSAIRAQLRTLIDRWEEARQERNDIADNFHFYRDGKSQTIEQFASVNL